MSIKSKIDYVVTHLYDPSSEHSSYGRLNRLDCAIANDIVPRNKEDMAKLTVWNGYEILRTSVVINSTVSRE